MAGCELYEKCQGRLKEAETKIFELEKSKVSTDLLVSQFTKSIENMSTTMTQVKDTMVEMQGNLRDINRETGIMNGKIDNLDSWVQKENEKNNIDIREIQKEKLKDNIKKYGMGVVGVAGAYGLFELISGLIDKG